MISYFTNYFENENIILHKSDKNGGLFLGNYQSALDSKFINDNKISVIVNCSKDLPYIYDIMDDHGLSRLETFRIPVNDSLMDEDFYIMEQYLHTVIPFLLKKLLVEKKNILVHCRAGRQRSASVIAALLFILIENKIMKFDKSNELLQYSTNRSKIMDNVIKYILIKRPQAFSYGMRVNFKPSLDEYLNLT